MEPEILLYPRIDVRLGRRPHLGVRMCLDQLLDEAFGSALMWEAGCAPHVSGSLFNRAEVFAN